MKENKLFASQGEPIILSQIENEYDHLRGAFRDGAPDRSMLAMVDIMEKHSMVLIHLTSHLYGQRAGLLSSTFSERKLHKDQLRTLPTEWLVGSQRMEDILTTTWYSQAGFLDCADYQTCGVRKGYTSQEGS
ncbi:uncharacterized protein LOC141633285 isoform X2 [Silene latifolia]|uniref:uncharacterized protein LOC141633285 isoform X2 n=1 Tax=Silene latifolia TaxID=37657 RepID=UPI003D76FE32